MQQSISFSQHNTRTFCCCFFSSSFHSFLGYCLVEWNSKWLSIKCRLNRYEERIFSIGKSIFSFHFCACLNKMKGIAKKREGINLVIRVNSIKILFLLLNGTSCLHKIRFLLHKSKEERCFAVFAHLKRWFYWNEHPCIDLFINIPVVILYQCHYYTKYLAGTMHHLFHVQTAEWTKPQFFLCAIDNLYLYHLIACENKTDKLDAYRCDLHLIWHPFGLFIYSCLVVSTPND